MQFETGIEGKFVLFFTHLFRMNFSILIIFSGIRSIFLSLFHVSMNSMQENRIAPEQWSPDARSSIIDLVNFDS